VHAQYITGDAINWIESFLSNRKQQVVCEGFTDALEVASVTSGVPLGQVKCIPCFPSPPASTKNPPQLSLLPFLCATPSYLPVILKCFILL